MLSHGADVVVFFCVVVEVVVMERIGLVTWTLLYMEAVVLDVGLHAGLVHEAVVFLGAISRVGNRHRGEMPVTAEEGVEKRYERESVGRIGVQGEVGDELVLGGELQIVSGLGLAVVHRVLFHAHERGVGVGLRHGVAFLHLLQTAVIFIELVAVFFQFPYLLFPLATDFLPLFACRFRF